MGFRSRPGALELDGNLALNNAPTPTASGTELRLAVFSTLTEALDYAAQGETDFSGPNPYPKDSWRAQCWDRLKADSKQ